MILHQANVRKWENFDHLYEKSNEHDSTRNCRAMTENHILLAVCYVLTHLLSSFSLDIDLAIVRELVEVEVKLCYKQRYQEKRGSTTQRLINKKAIKVR